MSHKVSDSIRTHDLATKDEATKQQAARDADAAYAGAQDATRSTDKTVKADLKKLGKPFPYTDDSGALLVYVQDTTEKGYTVLKPAGPDESVDDDDAPPAPAPDDTTPAPPEPAPAPEPVNPPESAPMTGAFPQG